MDSRWHREIPLLLLRRIRCVRCCKVSGSIYLAELILLMASWLILSYVFYYYCDGIMCAFV